MTKYLGRLKAYAKHIEICGEKRNSYAKTDNDATFMRIKRDYMGNDQLVPAYNVQAAICDEYIAVIDAKQYASDMECFVHLANLESIHSALLCMNRSIQSEGTFGIIKWDRFYKRLFRRGLKGVIL